MHKWNLQSQRLLKVRAIYKHLKTILVIDIALIHIQH